MTRWTMFTTASKVITMFSKITYFEELLHVIHGWHWYFSFSIMFLFNTYHAAFLACARIHIHADNLVGMAIGPTAGT